MDSEQILHWEDRPEGKDLIEWEYEVVMSEARAGKAIGRPWSITLERYKAFTLFYMNTQMKSSSCRRAGITESAVDRLLAASETFRVILGQLEEDTKFIARFNISRSIRGRDEQKIKKINDEGKEVEVTLPAVPPSVEDSKWALGVMFRDKENKPTGPQLGVPQTQEEVENMAKMLALYDKLTNHNATESEGDITTSNPNPEQRTA